MVLDALILQSKLFLQDDMGVKIEEIVEQKDDNITKLQLKDYSSMIGTGGKLSLMVIVSYDLSLLQHLIDMYLEGESVSKEEQEEIRESVAGEVVNTILGLALPTFPNRGKGVTITPPVTLNNPSHVIKHKTAKIQSIHIKTDHGELTVSVIESNK